MTSSFHALCFFLLQINVLCTDNYLRTYVRIIGPHNVIKSKLEALFCLPRKRVTLHALLS